MKKKKLISITLIVLFIINSTIVFAENVTYDSYKTIVQQNDLEQAIQQYPNIDVLTDPNSRLEIAKDLIVRINSSPDKQLYHEKFAEAILESATKNRSLQDAVVIWGLVKKELVDNPFKTDITAKFELLKIELRLELIEDSNSGYIPGNLDDVNHPNGNSGSAQTDTSSPEYTPPDAESEPTNNPAPSNTNFAYSRVEFKKVGNELYRIETFYDYSNKKINEVKTIASDKEKSEQGFYTPVNEEPNDNGMPNQPTYEEPTNVTQFPIQPDFDYKSLIYDSKGELLATESSPGVYDLNTYTLIYTNDKYAPYTKYKSTHIQYSGEYISYESLKRAFKTLSINNKAFFVDENSRFVAIIDGNTFSFKKDALITKTDLAHLFKTTKFLIKTELISTIQYSEANKNGVELYKKKSSDMTVNDSTKSYTYQIEGIDSVNNQVVVVDNTYMFPLKSTAKDLGFNVFETETEITFTKDNHVTTYKLNSNVVVVNGVSFKASQTTFKSPSGEIYGLFTPDIFGSDLKIEVTSD